MEGIWNESKRELLMERVQRHPSLWDKGHRYYSRKDINNRKWNKIGKYLGCSGDEALHQFNVLKQRYARYIKRTRSGVLKKKVKPFLLEEKMNFLKSSLEKIKTEIGLLSHDIVVGTIGTEEGTCSNLVHEAENICPKKVKSSEEVGIGSVSEKPRNIKVKSVQI